MLLYAKILEVSKDKVLLIIEFRRKGSRDRSCIAPVLSLENSAYLGLIRASRYQDRTPEY
jgi:hypothetical protein